MVADKDEIRDWVERPLMVWLVVRYPDGGEPWEIQGVFARQEWAEQVCLSSDPQWGAWYVIPLLMNKVHPVEAAEPSVFQYRPTVEKARQDAQRKAPA